MRSTIKAISYYLPEQILTNEDLRQRFPDLRIDDLTRLTGVRERRISAEGETAVDMAEQAALNLFAEHNIDPATIDFIILCTQWPDYITPSSSCLLQDRLSIPKSAGTVDISQGCTGYVYGLSLAKGLIESGSVDNVLLLTSETITKSIHPKDRSNLAIFGDAATATILTLGNPGDGFLGSMVFGTDGSGYQEIIIKNGGARFPHNKFSAEEHADNFGNVRSDEYFYMNGAAIFTFSINTVPGLIRKTLEKNNVKFEEIDLFIFHQANQIILESLFRKIRIPEGKSFIHLEKTGNTVSSTIPIAFYEALKQGRIRKGSKVLLAGFGVGLSWAATIIQL